MPTPQATEKLITEIDLIISPEEPAQEEIIREMLAPLVGLPQPTAIAILSKFGMEPKEEVFFKSRQCLMYHGVLKPAKSSLTVSLAFADAPVTAESPKEAK